MKWKTPEKRKYYEKYEEVPLQYGQNWFSCYKLPGDVYAICEPQHFQEVNAYLIIGSTRAVLFDTGMGIANIKAVVEELYRGELIVVNSHFHFDHIGDNWRFDQIVIPDDPYAKNIAEKGIPSHSLGNQMDEDMFLFDYPAGFDADSFSIKPYKVAIAEDGELFDLGNRTLEYVKTPGHSDDCIMLYDQTNAILFCGDMFYLGALYIHFDCEEFGKSSLHKYAASINKVIEKFPAMKSIYASHNDFVIAPEKLVELRDALTAIIERKCAGKLLENLNHGYLEEPQKLVEYVFEDFSIVVKE